MNFLRKSKKAFQSMIRKNEISKKDWDIYAQNNYLYSALTLEIHEFTEKDWFSDEEKFELLKKKMKR